MESRRGFTIIEILLAISAILIVTLAFFFLTKTCLSKQNYSEKFHSALGLAQKTMEEIKAASFEAISDKSFDKGKGTIIVTPIDPSLRDIFLSLKWQSSRPPIELETMRAK